MIVDAIRSEQFLVPTKPSYAKQLRDRCDALVDKALPPMPDFEKKDWVFPRGGRGGPFWGGRAFLGGV